MHSAEGTASGILEPTMGKANLILLLAAATSSVLAEEWVAVGTTEDGGITVYADQSTIRKERNIVRIRTLGDFKKAEKLGSKKQFLSLMEQYEYDCNEERMRRLYATMHSENMGRGSVVASGPINEAWQSVPPDSLNEQLWEFACGKN